MDFLIKGILALFWLAVIPTACGALFFKKHDTFSFAKSLLFGYLLLFSLAELLILLFMYFNRRLLRNPVRSGSAFRRHPSSQTQNIRSAGPEGSAEYLSVFLGGCPIYSIPDLRPCFSGASRC